MPGAHRKLMKLRLLAIPNPRRLDLQIDGNTIPVTNVNLDFPPDAPPTAVIELPVLEQDIESPQTLIALHTETRKLLIKMGWHPPLGDDPSLPWANTKEWQMLALLILSAGGRIAIPESAMTGTDFDQVTVEVERDMVNHQIIYKAAVAGWTPPAVRRSTGRDG